MSSIVTAVFKATIGLLVTKGRDNAAKRLKEGDVTDKKIRELIVREIDDIKSKLDGLTRKDLLAAIDAFEAGLGYLYQIDVEADEVTPSPEAAVTRTVSLAAGMRKMRLAELDETKRTLSDAKSRFKMAREEATRAFNNEALSTFDRITAIRYRVMATILESAVETAGAAGDLSSFSVKSALKRALPECEQCLKKLHSLPDVENNFKVELEKGLLNIKGRFGKHERREIISTVCQINRAIYDALQTVGKAWIWPTVDIGVEKVDPLHDGRVFHAMHKVGMGHCCVLWSFGQEGDEERKLKFLRGIATNAEGQFIIAGGRDNTVNVFDSSWEFLFSFILQNADARLEILHVATDIHSNIYVLCERKKPGAREYEREVQVFEKTAALIHKFPVRRGDSGRLAVSSSKVLVLWKTKKSDYVVDVYEHDGEYVRSFEKEMLKNARDITVDRNGRVMVVMVDRDGQYCVNVFMEDGAQLSKFSTNTECLCDCFIACHPADERVLVAGKELDTCRPRVAIFTKDGDLVRSIVLDDKRMECLVGITVTMEGHVAVAVRDEHNNGKVIILKTS